MPNALVRNSMIYAFGALMTKAVAFLLIPVYTRFFSVEEYGILAIVNVVIQLLTFVCLLGISSAAMRFYFDEGADENRRRAVYGNALILLLVFPALLTLLFLPLVRILALRFVPAVPFAPYFFVAVVISFFAPLQQLVKGLLRVQERPRAFVAFTLSFFLVQTTAIIAAVVGLGAGLAGMLYAQAAVNVLFWAVALVLLRRNSAPAFSPATAKELLLFGLPLVPFFVFTWVNSATGRFLLERYDGLAGVGIFALAAQFSGLLAIIGNAFSNALVPYFYRTAGEEGGGDRLGTFATKYLALFSIIALFILALYRPAVIVMAHSRYHGALPFIPPLVFAGWLNLTYMVFHWSLMHSRKTGLLALLHGAAAALTVALMVYLLKYRALGIDGVVAALVIVELFKNAAGFAASQRFYPIRFRYGRTAAVVLTALAGAALVHLIGLRGPLVSATALNILLAGGISLLLVRLSGVGSIREMMA